MDYEEIISHTIIRGDTWNGINFTINKQGIDYTDADVIAHFKNVVDGKLIVQKTIVPTSGVLGTIVFDLALTAAETALFNTDCAVVDIQITTDDDGVKTPILINLRIVKDVTK